MHCLRPNRLPSTNTFYEHFYTPTSLEGAIKSFEPSKRLWWIDGCPLDSDSEMWTVKSDGRGNMLKTTLPSFSDDSYDLTTKNKVDVQTSRQHSTSPLDAPIRSGDETANTPPKRSVRYIPNEVPSLNIPDVYPEYPYRVSKPILTEKEFKVLRQEASQKIEAARLRTKRRLGVNDDRCSNVTGGSLPFTLDVISVNEARDEPAKRVATGSTYTNESRKSLFRVPTVLPKAEPANSPTHHTLEIIPPSEIPARFPKALHRQIS